MQITTNKVATFDFTVSAEDGQILDSSEGTGPFPYIHGTGYLVPGLEEAMEGKSAGDSFKVEISPEKAYGERSEALLMDVPMEKFEGMEDLEIGTHIQVGSPEGTRIMEVTAMTADSVTLDGNHPLAGMTLHFDVSIVDVRDATPEELDHGHPAGAECGSGCDDGCCADSPETNGGGCGCGCSGGC